MNAIEQFSEAIRLGGYWPLDDVVPGQLNEIYPAPWGFGDPGWAIVFAGGVDGAFGAFDDPDREECQTWHANGEPKSDAEQAIFDTKVARAKANADSNFRKKGAEAACLADALWCESKPADDKHHFLIKHLIKANGARMVGEDLAIPVRDADGAVHSLQYVSRGEFLENGRNRGHFFIIGELGDTMCVVADFESGASIHHATGLAVAVAFEYENFEPVVAAIKARRPKATVILCDCCGEDEYKVPPGWTPPDWVMGCVEAVPNFGTKRGGMDYSFNDLHRVCGLEAVRREVLAALPNQPAPSGVLGIGPAQRQHAFTLQPASEIAERLPQQWVIEGVLPAKGCGAIYGQTQAGKSTIALDMLSAIATGSDWFGLPVIKAPVVYICLEGEDGLGKRIQACTDRYGADVAEIQVVTNDFHLNDPAQVHDLGIAIVETVGHGAIVAIDTLNRAIPDVDENSSGGMGSALGGCKELQRITNGMILLVHHAGKDATRGMRGHSNLLAGLDVAIEVSQLDGDRRQWRIQKLRDGCDSANYPFRLDVVDVGTDAVGNPISACVIVPLEDAIGAVLRKPKERKQPGPRGANQKAVYAVAVELLRRSDFKGQGGSPADFPCVRLDALTAGCRGELKVDSDRQAERIQLAVQGLEASGFLQSGDGWVWVP